MRDADAKSVYQAVRRLQARLRDTGPRFTIYEDVETVEAIIDENGIITQ